MDQLENRVKNISLNAYRSLKDECERVRREELNPLLDALAHCQPHDDEKSHSRKKRVAWFIPVLVIVAIVLIASAVASLYYIVSLKEKTEAMQERQVVLEKNLLWAKDSLVKAENTTGNINLTLNALAHESALNREMIYEVGGLVPEISWRAAQLLRKLQGEIVSITAIVEGCRRRTVPIAALTKLTKLDSALSKIQERDTYFNSVVERRELDERVLRLNFNGIIRDEHTKIYELHHMDLYNDLKNDPHVVTYTGPAHAMYNSTANCTKGVLIDSNVHLEGVVDECITPNYRDPRLDMWKRVERNASEILPPQIHRLGNHKYIYCTYHNITIDGETAYCPPYPFAVRLNQTFTLNNIVHRAEYMRLKGATVVSKLQTGGWRQVEVDSEFMEVMKLIEEVRKSQLELKRANEELARTKFGTQEGGFYHDLIKYLPEPSFGNIVGCASLVIGLICLCLNTCIHHDGNGGEHVTVIQSPPSPILPPSPYPHVKCPHRKSDHSEDEE